MAAGAALAQSNFSGEIMDSSYAKMGDNAKACTQACVKAGAQYVLYDAGTKKTYVLDDQTKSADFAGQTQQSMFKASSRVYPPGSAGPIASDRQ